MPISSLPEYKFTEDIVHYGIYKKMKTACIEPVLIFIYSGNSIVFCSEN